MKAGAADVLTKPVGRALLREAVRLALNRSDEGLREEVELNGIRERFLSLSGREREVMTLVVSGLMNKQVGGELGISEITVKAHRGRMVRKMKARSLANLVIMAARLQAAGVSSARYPLGIHSVSTRYPSLPERRAENRQARHVVRQLQEILAAPIPRF
jgi:DNA-binding CsgD family transcriptional regulator